MTTPPARAVSLEVATEVSRPGLGLVPPTVRPVPCPDGALGLSVRVTPGTVAATLDGSVTVAVNGAEPVVVPIDRTLTPGTPPATISACVGA